MVQPATRGNKKAEGLYNLRPAAASRRAAEATRAGAPGKELQC